MVVLLHRNQKYPSKLERLCATQAWRHEGAFGAVPTQITSCAPTNKNCALPSEDCASKKLTGSVLLECNLRPETPKILVVTPEFVSKNCFFVDFAIKIVCLCGCTQEFMKIRVYFEMKTFFFWSSPQVSRNFADFWRRRPNFLENRVIFETKTIFLVFAPDFVEFHKGIKFSCPPKIPNFVYAPPVTPSWRHL